MNVCSVVHHIALRNKHEFTINQYILHSYVYTMCLCVCERALVDRNVYLCVHAVLCVSARRGFMVCLCAAWAALCGPEMRLLAFPEQIDSFLRRRHHSPALYTMTVHGRYACLN